MKRMRTLDQRTREGNLLQGNVEEVLGRLQQSTILDGVLLKDVATSIGSFTVSHELGRAPVGFLITKSNAPMCIYNDTVGNTPSKLLYLKANAQATVDLWVF